MAQVLETFSTQNYLIWEHGSVWLAVCFIALLQRIECCNGVKSAHRETVTEWHIKCFQYDDCDLVDGNIRVVNKYSELHQAAIRSLVYTAQTALCQLLFGLYGTYSCMATSVWSIQHRELYDNFCSLYNTFLYTVSPLHTLHILIPQHISLYCTIHSITITHITYSDTTKCLIQQMSTFFKEIYNLFVEIYTLHFIM